MLILLVVISRIGIYCGYGRLKDDFYFLMYRVPIV